MVGISKKAFKIFYFEFDNIARQLGVFKVETIGDCYVAACGVPNACSDHFTIMSRYANDCVRAFGKKVKELEVMLGPDTGDLALRGKPDTFA